LSLSLNLEANVMVYDSRFNRQLRKSLDRLIARDCQLIDESRVPKQTYWQLTKSVVVFHFLRHFPAWIGWLPAHTPKLSLVAPPEQAKIEAQDSAEPEKQGAKP